MDGIKLMQLMAGEKNTHSLSSIIPAIQQKSLREKNCYRGTKADRARAIIAGVMANSYIIPGID